MFWAGSSFEASLHPGKDALLQQSRYEGSMVGCTVAALIPRNSG